MRQNFEKDEYYAKPRLKATEAFGINHYAGQVEYKVTGFLNKNKDAVPELFQTLMQHSGDGFLRMLFDGPDELPQGGGPGGGGGGGGGDKGAKKGPPKVRQVFLDEFGTVFKCFLSCSGSGQGGRTPQVRSSGAGRPGRRRRRRSGKE